MLDAKINRIHIIGIGGFAMSAIAEILHSENRTVSGSDLIASSVTKRLEQKGIKISVPQSEDNIVDGIELVIYSSAVKNDNAELMKAIAKGIQCVKRPEFLSMMTEGYQVFGFSGTHGKTTTTSMVSKIYFDAGLDPNIMIGGNVPWLNNCNAYKGKSNLLLIEADEYDKTFLSLSPEAAIVTNIDHEHKDTYPTFEEEKSTFLEFMNKIPENGFCLVCNDSEAVRELANSISSKVITYALDHPADYQAELISKELFTQTFIISKNEKSLGEIELPVPGKHNLSNALAAAAFCVENGIEFETIKKSFANFRNADRRLQIKYDNGITVIDDYAHHPEEIKASLSSVSNADGRKVIAVFQPHLYSRTQDFYKEFGKALSSANEIIVAGIFPAREKPIDGVTGKLIADEVLKYNTNVKYFEDKEEIPAVLKVMVGNNDIVITMGAGDIWKIGEEFIREISG